MKKFIFNHFTVLWFTLIFVMNFIWWLFLIGIFALVVNCCFVDFFTIKNCIGISVLWNIFLIVIAKEKLMKKKDEFLAKVLDGVQNG